MSKYFDQALKSLRKPIVEGRGIKVFPLEEDRTWIRPDSHKATDFWKGKSVKITGGDHRGETGKVVDAKIDRTEDGERVGVYKVKLYSEPKVVTLYIDEWSHDQIEQEFDDVKESENKYRVACKVTGKTYTFTTSKDYDVGDTVTMDGRRRKVVKVLKEADHRPAIVDDIVAFLWRKPSFKETAGSEQVLWKYVDSAVKYDQDLEEWGRDLKADSDILHHALVDLEDWMADRKKTMEAIADTFSSHRNIRLYESELPPLDPKIADAVEKIISDYEKGKLKYDDAHRRIIDASEGHPALYWMEIDLWSARSLKKTDQYLKPVKDAIRKVVDDVEGPTKRALELVLKGKAYMGRQNFKKLAADDRDEVTNHPVLSDHEKELLSLYFAIDDKFDETEEKLFKHLGIDPKAFDHD